MTRVQPLDALPDAPPRRWSPEQRARFRETMAAKHGPQRCDICAIEPGEPTGHHGPAVVLSFHLIHARYEPDGRHTSRGVGVIFLCRRCWETTAARRRRRRRRAAQPF